MLGLSPTPSANRSLLASSKVIVHDRSLASQDTLRVVTTSNGHIGVQYDESREQSDQERQKSVIKAVAEMLRFGTRDGCMISTAVQLGPHVWNNWVAEDQLLDMIEQLIEVTLLNADAFKLAHHLAECLQIQTARKDRITAVTYHRTKLLLYVISMSRKLPECSENQELWTSLDKSLTIVSGQKIFVPSVAINVNHAEDKDDQHPLITIWKEYIKDPSSSRFEALKSIAPFRRLLLLRPSLSESKLVKNSSKKKRSLIRTSNSLNKSTSLKVRSHFLRFWASLLMGNPHPNVQLNKIHPEVQDLVAEHVAKCIDTIGTQMAAEQSMSDLKQLSDATSVALQASLQAVRVQCYRMTTNATPISTSQSTSAFDAKRVDKKLSVGGAEKRDVCRDVALKIAETLLTRSIHSSLNQFTSSVLVYNMEDIVSTMCFITAAQNTYGVTSKLEDDYAANLLELCDQSILEASKLCPHELSSHIPRLFNAYDSVHLSITTDNWFQCLSNLYPHHCNIELWENTAMFTDTLVNIGPNLGLLNLLQKMSLNIETVKHINRFLMTKPEVLDKLECTLQPTDDQLSLLSLKILCNLAKNKAFSIDFINRGDKYFELIDASSVQHYQLVVQLLITIALSKSGNPSKIAKILIKHVHSIKDVQMQEGIMEGLISLCKVNPAAVFNKQPISQWQQLTTVPNLQMHVQHFLQLKKDYEKSQKTCQIM